MSKPKLDQKRALAWRIFATLALLAVAVYTLGTHWHTVSASLSVVRHASAPWALLALGLMVLTLGIASAIYGVLALHRLRLQDTLLIQLAASFVGRLLPAGLGGLGLNGVYLYRRRHTPAEATAVVSVNNLIGMGAHLLLLAVVIALHPTVLGSLFHHLNASVSGTLVIVCAVGIVGICSTPTVRSQLSRFAVNLAVSIKKERPRSLLAALLLAGMLTATYTALLYAAARAVGVQLEATQIFVVFSFGMLAGTATPTPGGLVGIEAGLFAGFTAYGVSSADAGAAVLLYRLVTYWLPLLPGAAALLLARRRGLV